MSIPSKAEILAELKSLTQAAEAYMEYHTAKFYANSKIGNPQGLWPDIRKARAVIKRAQP